MAAVEQAAGPRGQGGAPGRRKPRTNDLEVRGGGCYALPVVMWCRGWWSAWRVAHGGSVNRTLWSRIGPAVRASAGSCPSLCSRPFDWRRADLTGNRLCCGGASTRQGGHGHLAVTGGAGDPVGSWVRRSFRPRRTRRVRGDGGGHHVAGSLAGARRDGSGGTRAESWACQARVTVSGWAPSWRRLICR